MLRPTLQGFARELHEALEIFYEEKFGKAGGEAKSWAKRCKVEAALKEFFEEEDKKEAEMSEAADVPWNPLRGIHCVTRRFCCVKPGIARGN